MPKVNPEPIRTPESDHLLTPQNCALALIDFQPEQYATVTSASKERINLNVKVLAQAAAKYEVPVVLSTVGVDMGVNQGTEEEIKAELPGVPEIDRTGVNAWEDPDFQQAIRDTGRRKIVIAGLWTEVCLTYPTLDMLAEGFDVYPVADAVGGISPESHQWAMERMIAAGASPVTALAFAGELLRNWARPDSDKVREIMKWYFPAKAELDKAGK
ncbi:nicotinamidase-related amidase [Brevibacterium sanguinis]|uniref:Nicotinamidase-related amidase n=2 Tax=Brevibacterium TaxID=1696 RepID=A0A366IJS1_9MICO|nr:MULTISPECIES: isochorismatase family protein [Brevibacterium]RBP64912.1 nicotinamidase-related amidase [Brevibacterium sanguinis]RBP71175.1 nicotinamidase-related amidase [Brevibacterium celere]